ncbi:MAG: hypothetical protein ABEN55_22110 [Bradymonadaceae bacterium]
MMLRVWCEHLDYADARRPETLDVLEQGALSPLVAVRPDADRVELAELIDAVQDRDLEIGVWPLVAKEIGYWPSVRNASRFADYLFELLGDLDDRGARPDWVAFDFEPPFQPDDTFGASFRRAFRRALGHLVDPEPADREPTPFDRALATFREAVERLNDEGIGTLGVATPTVVGDLGRGLDWQRSLETPWSPLPWDRAGIMAYGSMIAGYSQGLLDYADARAAHYQFLRRVHGTFGEKAHVSVGITGTGVYGDEPYYADPEELTRDIAAARAAGVEDIAVFCLEGILQKERPGQWVDAMTEVEPAIPPTTWRAESVVAGVGMLSKLLGVLRGSDVSTPRTA